METSVKNETDKTTSVKEDHEISILQFSRWLSLATSGHKNFLTKPTDLQILYLLFLWEYISSNVGDNFKYNNVPDITKDKQIKVSEKKLVHMVQLFFHSKYYPLFNRIYNM